MKNRTYIFDDGAGGQVGVELWEDGEVTVMVREDRDSIWSPKLDHIRDEGDPVQFWFESSPDDDSPEADALANHEVMEAVKRGEV